MVYRTWMYSCFEQLEVDIAQVHHDHGLVASVPRSATVREARNEGFESSMAAGAISARSHGNAAEIASRLKIFAPSESLVDSAGVKRLP
jgi:hypothetical protein